jgi:UDPglucose 6-dehydrogenase
MKITVVGTGYVGLSLAALFSKNHSVVALDIDPEKIEKINKRIAIFDDDLLIDLFNNETLNLKATLNQSEAYSQSDYIIISVPTNYDPNTNAFNVSIVESIIKNITLSGNNCPIIIKSTVPVGFTEKCRVKFSKKNIYFSPEFLREGKAVHDITYPSRIIVGGTNEEAKLFGKLLLDVTNKKKSINKIPLLFMESSEAEAVKLFSNTYLAMRIAYFNELDSFCEINKLDTKNIIEGVGYDSRIGNYYNNPSFGYGGYCLPKDTNQLLKNYNNVPNSIIRAIVDANKTRKDFIAEQIIKKKPKVVGIFRLIMKEGSDNFRDSSIQGIIRRIKAKGIQTVIYEPKLEEKLFFESKVISELETFFNISDLIVANRNSSKLDSVREKLYTRDIFQEN